MTLTKEEKELVVNKMKVYPAGVSSNAWGTGVMCEEKMRYYGPTYFTKEQLEEFG